MTDIDNILDTYVAHLDHAGWTEQDINESRKELFNAYNQAPRYVKIAMKAVLSKWGRDDFCDLEGVLYMVEALTPKAETGKDARYAVAKFIASYHEQNDVTYDGMDEELRKVYHDFGQIPYWQGQSINALCEELHQIVFDGGPDQYIDVARLLLELQKYPEGEEWLSVFSVTSEHSH